MTPGRQDSAAASQSEEPPALAPLRLGLVGCGFQGAQLAAAAGRSGAVELIACADPEKAAIAGVAALRPEVVPYPTVEALLEQAEVDAIMVATPNHLLFPVSMTAMAAGKHVFVEKPFALNAKEATLLEAEAERARLVLMPGYSCRYSAGRQVFELLSSGVAGEVLSVMGQFGGWRMSTGWPASRDTGGGPLLFVGTHLVDLVLWFVGDRVSEVSATISRQTDDDIDETAAFQIFFARGAIAQCLVSQFSPFFFYSIDVVGRDGRVVLRGPDFDQWELEVTSNVVPTYTHPTVVRSQMDRIGSMLLPELEEFAAAVRESRPPYVTAADGRRVLEVLDAVVLAGRERRTVKLPLPEAGDGSTLNR
jgi:UDP-N-acetyl-2-amino-2-deoxyglucuronate dehydrogenase